MRKRAERFQERIRFATKPFIRKQIEADHLAKRMHASIGSASARGIDAPTKQQLKGIFDIPLNRKLPILPREARKRLSIV